MIDTHAHIIKEYFNNIEELVEELKQKNVIYVINCSTSINDAKEIIELSNKTNNFLLPAIGIHPEIVNDFNKINELEELIKNNKIVAIGEIGLDYYWNKENKEEQKKCLKKQLDLAEKYNLPILVHTRESIQDTFDILKDRKLKTLNRLERIKVALARLSLRELSIIIIDDIFDMLSDYESEKLIKSIKELIKSNSATAIVTVSNDALAKKFNYNTVHLKYGSIVEHNEQKEVKD